MTKSKAGKPYRPGNGTEGEMFEDAFCENCKRDQAYRSYGLEIPNDDGSIGCPILAAMLGFGTDEPGYPKELIYDRKGKPTCTAFDPIGDKND